MITRSVTVAKIKPEYWQMIKDGRKQYEIRDSEVGYESNVFVFVDADSQTYLGCARIKSETRFGGYEASPWSWNMLSLLGAVPVDELKDLFSWLVDDDNTQHGCEMYAYEVEPIDEATLTAYIIHGTSAFTTKTTDE